MTPSYEPYRSRLGKESDSSIAKDAGVSYQAVALWRRKLGIPAYKWCLSTEEFIRIWFKCKTRDEAMAKTKLSRFALQSRVLKLQRQGIHLPQLWSRRRLKEIQRLQVDARLFERSRSIEEAARKLKGHPAWETPARYAARLRTTGYLTKRFHHWRHDRRWCRRFLRLWRNPKLTRQDIATRLGLSHSCVCHWARVFNLPSKPPAPQRKCLRNRKSRVVKGRE